MLQSSLFSRTELLLGSAVFDVLRRTRVAVFGLGGVGSWCLEALTRSGIGEFLLVDFDKVASSNVNRQLPATSETIGEVKVRVLAERMRAINPDVKLELRETRYTPENAADFPLETYDYVIDAIDSVPCKAALIRHALAQPATTLFSSMGAALKMDPARVRTSDFRKVEGDGLARALRQNFKKTGLYPPRKFTCVWSDEHRANLGPKDTNDPGNGTVAHMTAIFGLTLAGLVIQDVERRAAQ